MFEDLLAEQNIDIAALSRLSGVGYNYIYKIVMNQTDVGRCGIDTYKKIGDIFHMSLDDLYAYKEEYYNKKIYYKDQSEWQCSDFGRLNAELNKMILIAIDYSLSKRSMSRDRSIGKKISMEITAIRFEKLSEQTKCIMTAILNQQKCLNEFTEKYKNLKGLRIQKPLKEELFLSQEPYDIFPSYLNMNIRY